MRIRWRTLAFEFFLFNKKKLDEVRIQINKKKEEEKKRKEKKRKGWNRMMNDVRGEIEE